MDSAFFHWFAKLPYHLLSFQVCMCCFLNVYSLPFIYFFSHFTCLSSKLAAYSWHLSALYKFLVWIRNLDHFVYRHGLWPYDHLRGLELRFSGRHMISPPVLLLVLITWLTNCTRSWEMKTYTVSVIHKNIKEKPILILVLFYWFHK